MTGPVANGKVVGPAVGGIILSSFAHGLMYNDATLEVLVIDVYLVTSDRESFNIHGIEIGSIEAQVTTVAGVTSY